MKKIDLQHYKRISKTLSHMKDRCYNKHCDDYPMWGGRGITICDEWLNDYMSFYNWAISNGYDDTLTIDRIDNNKGYYPDNCRWVTRKTQARNTRRNRIITFNGETRSLAEWCEVLNLNYYRVKRRLQLGWNVYDVFFKNKQK